MKKKGLGKGVELGVGGSYGRQVRDRTRPPSLLRQGSPTDGHFHPKTGRPAPVVNPR